MIRNIVTLMLILISFTGWAQQYQQLIDLKGTWKFSIGDDIRWAKNPKLNTHWIDISAPSSWENQGFEGYDGFAWYKKDFNSMFLDLKQPLYLLLGKIDDVDQVFLNGQLIGQTGEFPPYQATAYTIERVYYLPSELIKKGKNTIMVRIYDDRIEGGLIKASEMGIYTNKGSDLLSQNLSGKWKFKTGDRKIYASYGFDDRNWEELNVPQKWDEQGYRDFDGIAWYRKSFSLNFNPNKNEELYLVLGFIDDVDYTYFNGQLIGNSEELKDNFLSPMSEQHKLFRAYPIPQKLIKKYGKNTVAVKVRDFKYDGGIYSGNVGLITKTNLLKLKKKLKKRPNLLEYIYSIFEN